MGQVDHALGFDLKPGSPLGSLGLRFKLSLLSAVLFPPQLVIRIYLRSLWIKKYLS